MDADINRRITQAVALRIGQLVLQTIEQDQLLDALRAIVREQQPQPDPTRLQPSQDVQQTAERA